ncbi:VC1465 family Xer recombination activation factor [Vibrio fluvialis]|uniref:VC1465 family Xer recombination activation factor n=1 Tax=Vibrio fluvialis TaxID=676 RepID=UPI001C9CA4F3|nr:VC1465 family Xer recombination activation factor [Vibrio fluvialis]MBY7824325.1 helix-turn-helix domain-containing protein [Vibrio fluvialis]MBY7824333.1 helix-turn-helix domain-containing protein [Vibrio fluvialis]MCE7658435.1 VC1465 family Xer recombination activation factor [Vibrio fluvialis]
MAEHARPNHAGPAWIKSTREAHGLTTTQAAEMCCVTTQTWRRWESGRCPMNPCIFQYWLSVLEKRLLPRSGLNGQRWQGWHFDNGKLVTPYGEQLTAAQIESLQQQVSQTRSVYRQAHKIREHAKSGLLEAGESWHGWQFKGGYLISPDERKIAPDELYVMMVGFDAMSHAKTHRKAPPETQDTAVLSLRTKCS